MGTGLASSGASVKANAGTPTVTFTGATPNAGNWAIQVCSNIGADICAKYGVNVNMNFSGTSPAAIASLIAGSTTYTSALYDAVEPVYLQNPNIEYVASGYDTLPYDLIVNPSITSVADLAGKTCGATAGPTVSDGLYDQLMIASASNGTLHYPTNYNISTVAVATVPTAIAAFQSGSIQCAGDLPPISGELNALGYPTLIHAATLKAFQGLPFFGINTLKSWVARNKTTNIKFLEGYLASVAWLENPANENAAIAILEKNSGASLAASTSAYEYVTDGGFPREGLIRSDAIKHDLVLAHDFDRGTNYDLAELKGMVNLNYVMTAYAKLPVSVKCEKYVKAAVPTTEIPKCKKLYTN